MKKLLIIGGSGLFGRSIIDCGINKKLVRHKINKVFVISRKRISNQKKYQHININFINKNFVNIRKIPHVDYIIYSIRNKNISLSKKYFDHFKKLIKALSKKPKILFTSSGAVYGKNKNFIKKKENSIISLKKISQLNGYKKKYALEKIFMEKKFIELGRLNFKVSIARCFNFIGKHSLGDGQLIGKMINDGLNKKIISVNNSNKVYRAYLNTNDLVDWLVTILKKSTKNCPIYNVGSDKSISMKFLGKKIAKIFNKKIKFKEKKKLDTDYYVPSINKAKKLLKLKISINLNDSLNSFIK